MPTGRGMKVVIEAAAAPARSLQVRLTNETRAPITVPRHSPPWANAYSALVVAVKTDASGTVLERSTPVDDPLVGSLTIQPGETLSGQIDLDRRFPGLADALMEHDVVVFWSFQLDPVDGTPLARAGGWVLLPRQPPR